MGWADEELNDLSLKDADTQHFHASENGTIVGSMWYLCFVLNLWFVLNLCFDTNNGSNLRPPIYISTQIWAESQI